MQVLSFSLTTPSAGRLLSLLGLLVALGTATPAQAQTQCGWEGGQLRCSETGSNRYDNGRNTNGRYDRDRYDRDYDRYDRDYDRYNSSDRGYNRGNSRTERDVERLYQEVLGRPADSSGLDTYVRKVRRDGWSLSQVRNSLANSSELDEAINRVYQEVLGRQADRDGLRTYRSQIRGGRSINDVRRALSRSGEARGIR